MTNTIAYPAVADSRLTRQQLAVIAEKEKLGKYVGQVQVNNYIIVGFRDD